jgi:hypothetical protein
MVESSNPNWRRNRRVRQNDVDPMSRQIREQTGEARRPADYPNGLFQLDRGLNQVMSDELRKNVGYTDHDVKRAADGSTSEHLSELVSDRKDLVRIPEDRLSDLCQNQSSARTSKKLVPNALLEIFDLSTERLGCQPKILCGTRQGLRASDSPEVLQMVIIQIVHG